MKIPLQLITIDKDGFHLMVHARINGLKANVLIDTGATRSVFDKNRVEYYLGDIALKKFDKFFTGIGATRIETFATIIPSITFGNYTLEKTEMVIIDMAMINKSYAVFDLPRIDMVLGGDILLRLGAMIDYQNRLLLINLL